MCDIPLNTSHFEKRDDVDRRPHASECVEDDDDICLAAFARRWLGFVVVVHRTFAILDQERAIFFFPPPSPCCNHLSLEPFRRLLFLWPNRSIQVSLLY